MQDIYVPIRKKKKFNYESGHVFERLTYTGYTFMKRIHGHWVRYIEAVCICGEVKYYTFYCVAKGDTRSCGCLRREVTSKAMATHKLSKHPLYDVYKKMVLRCHDENDKAYKRYGGRGIEVWKDWRDEFSDFYKWAIENGWELGLSLDRIDNDGDYAPYNCRWATAAEQNRNTSRNRYYTAFGETKCLFDWGDDPRCLLSVWALRNRMDKGWDMERALTEPEDRKKASRNSKRVVNITAFGETKCLAAWVEDSRCVVAMDRLRDRIAEGWDGLEALTKFHVDKASKFLTVFGETKSWAEWLKDERCVVKVDALRDRIKKGWSDEDVITKPSKTRPKK